MALPNSRLGAMLRNKKAGKHGPLQDPYVSYAMRFSFSQ